MYGTEFTRECSSESWLFVVLDSVSLLAGWVWYQRANYKCSCQNKDLPFHPYYSTKTAPSKITKYRIMSRKCPCNAQLMWEAKRNVIVHENNGILATQLNNNPLHTEAIQYGDANMLMPRKVGQTWQDCSRLLTRYSPGAPLKLYRHCGSLMCWPGGMIWLNDDISNSNK